MPTFLEKNKHFFFSMIYFMLAGIYLILAAWVYEDIKDYELTKFVVCLVLFLLGIFLILSALVAIMRHFF